jgi:hypothetical protein
LVGGLVGDNEGLEVVAGVVDGLDELGGQDHVGDFGALAHDGGPDGELGMVACGGEGHIVAVLTHALHDVLVHNRKDEAVERAAGHLLRVARTVVRGVLGLVAVKDVRGRLDALGGGREALEEKGNDELSEEHERVVALHQRHLEVDKGRVLAARRVCLELVRLLLAQDAVCAGLLARLVADLGELLVQGGRVCLGPGLRLAAVGARAPDVDEDQDSEEGQDVHLQLEVLGRRALPHAVPGRVGPRAHGARLLGHVGGIGEGRDGGGRRVRSACVVGEVWSR